MANFFVTYDSTIKTFAPRTAMRPDYTLIITIAAIWLVSEILPLIIARSRRIKLSFWEYNHPLIRKSLLAINHNNKVFDALEIIQKNRLDLNIEEIAELYNSNIDFNEFVDAMHLAKERNINVSKEVLRELASFKKDLREIVMAKSSGDQVFSIALGTSRTNF